MKKMIIILGTIILGVYIVADLIMGAGTESLKGNAKNVVTQGKNVIETKLNTVTP